MSKKYHVNPQTGRPGVCSAKKACPFGDWESDHYSTAEEARQAYEVTQQAFSSCSYQWPELPETRTYAIPEGDVTLQISGNFSRGGTTHDLEGWLTNGDGNVAFIKLLVRDATYHPEVGPHLAMCDIETRPDQRKKGLARALRESIEKETGLLIYSSGNYTPEGFEAFGKHVRLLPNPYASVFDKPGVGFGSMGFVASWKHRLPRHMSREIDYSDEQREATWDDEISARFRAMDDKDLLWAED